MRKFGAGALAMIFFSSVALAADTLTGTVTNKTTNKPSAGDEVVLIRLEQGMQELTRAKTDAKGQFKLEVPDQNMHLVRVTHDGEFYFRPAPAGAESVEIDVYNAAAKVNGITSEADVMRIQTSEDGKSLRVMENFFVKNDSNPKMTQFGDRPFEFYLPVGAVVQGASALSPGGMPVQASPVPAGDPGHFTFVFPIRPGETAFQVSFSLPYSGSKGFAPKPSMPTETVAVMMPKSMTFKGGGWLRIMCRLRKRPPRKLTSQGMSLHRSRWSLRWAGRGNFRVRLRWRRRTAAGPMREARRQAAGRVLQLQIRGRVAGWGCRSMRRERMIRGRSTGGGLWAGWDWRWLRGRG